MSKASQITTILNDKIRRIAEAEHKKANPKPPKKMNCFKPYSLPSCVKDMTMMISECADPETTDERLDEIYQFATTGEVREKAFSVKN